MKLDLDLDVKWRRMERDILDESNEFVCLICKMICNFIPIAYVEEFDRLKKIALGNYRWGLKPKVVIYDVEGITINEIFKIYLMNIDIENTYKVDIQHSVAYNIGGYSWYNFMELHVCDEFLICNSMHNEMIPTKFTRMPFISFFRNNINQSESGNEIIYAAYVYPQHRGELAHVEWNWGKYISDELKFLKMLDKSVLSQFKYRKYPLFKNQWKVDERLKEEIPSIVFDEEPSFLKSINNAKLVISSLFGSAAMEAFAAGKPTIVLFNPKYSYVELNDNYKDVEDMIRVGIIAETPERLAHIVNSIHDDVESWWNEPERQGVVRRIREKYIYFPENAKEIWVEKITSYVD